MLFETLLVPVAILGFQNRQSAGLPAVDSLAIRIHVSRLAADSLRGRSTPSPELEIAARYVAEVMSRSGLEPLGDGGNSFNAGPTSIAT